jgi:two-component system sensor histidine kinase MtrB
VPGLRTRVIAAFCLGALLLSILLALVSYSIAREYLLRQRESSAVRQAATDAAFVLTAIDPEGQRANQVLDSLRGSLDSEPVLKLGDRWFAAAVGTGRDVLPAQLREQVAAGTAAKQRIVVDGSAALAVGVPLIGQGEFYEVFPLAELDRTLNTLRLTLAAAAAGAALVGAFGGWLVARRLMEPLRAVTETSSQLAQGHLDTRLAMSSDPDLARLATAYNSMADALQTRIERDSRFAADVSHELRSPLTTLETAVTVMERRREEMPERARTALDLISDEIRRFRQIVLDLLEISRRDARDVQEPVAEIRLAELLLRMGTEAPVEVDSDAAGAIVRGDKRRVERVVTNLVDNARTYAGGATAVRLVRAGECVRVLVDDRGPGVPEADRERIFERFARGRSSGQRGSSDGAGLGLAIVREHVSELGGSTWTTDAPGGGARFVVELPVARWA